mmetsp:Transcript_5508/g.13809  ORF Transcript_5508/g.13809 Transcript_5508/m.13809 type:complete len:103 (-) Transcript_5508:904-1212(-)
MQLVFHCLVITYLNLSITYAKIFLIHLIHIINLVVVENMARSKCRIKYSHYYFLAMLKCQKSEHVILLVDIFNLWNQIQSYCTNLLHALLIQQFSFLCKFLP